MKRYIYSMVSAALLLGGAAQAQPQDVNKSLVQVENKSQDLKFTVGARFFGDVGYYHSEYTPMNSGAAITDARIRTSLTYKDLYFYADFDFSKGYFTQKNIFVQYSFAQTRRGFHVLKAGYFNEPSTMAYNTSLYNYHFMSRPAPVTALAPGRALGVTYKFYNTHFFADQGFFSENKYNDQQFGYQGISLSGRWLYRPVNDASTTVHFGASLRYGHISTGTPVDGDAFKTQITIKSAMETAVDPTTRFLHAEVPWAKNTLDIGAEALLKTNRFFARGEYIYKKIYKKRPDQTLFENQLGGVWSWTTLAAWQKGNPIRTTNFSGAYVEAGWLILGDRYRYDNEYGLLKGVNEKGGLELVARYSYTELNDINKGDFFLIGKQTFYPGGVVADYPAVSTSIGGGNLHAFTVGLNYTFNQYIKLMGEYQFMRLNNVYFPNDKNFNMLQMRVMFSF
ncbi:MAG: hypothetical protein IJC16_01570 [Rikenellaceae bacterium]|nr:hypothetical protein [Rikenellaceae bacterium]